MLDLDELERLAATATPGPWHRGITPDDPDEAKRWIDDAWRAGRPGPAHMVIVAKDGVPLEDECWIAALTGNGPTGPQNAAFIAAAREAVPRLCEEVRQLREQDNQNWFLAADDLAREKLDLQHQLDEARTALHNARWSMLAEQTLLRELATTLDAVLPPMQKRWCHLLDKDGACGFCKLRGLLNAWAALNAGGA